MEHHPVMICGPGADGFIMVMAEINAMKSAA
jgi:hypothetical protein